MYYVLFISYEILCDRIESNSCSQSRQDHGSTDKQKRAAHLYQLADDGCISDARALRTESDAVGTGNRTALHDSV